MKNYISFKSNEILDMIMVTMKNKIEGIIYLGGN